MKQEEIVNILSAIANGIRLDILRHIIQKGEAGVQPGHLAEHFGVTKSNISFHLMQLLNAGLIHQRREGQFHYYTASPERLHDMASFLVSGLCGGTDQVPSVRSRDGGEAPMHEVAHNACALVEKTNEMNALFQEMLVNELVNYIDMEKTLRAEGALSQGGAQDLRHDLTMRLRELGNALFEDKPIHLALSSSEN